MSAKRLLLVGSIAVVTFVLDRLTKTWVEQNIPVYEGRSVIDDVVRIVHTQNNGAAFGLLLRHGNHGGLPKPFVDRMYEDFDRGTKRAVLALYRATGDIDRLSAAVSAELAPLRRPALVVWGANDPYLPSEQAENQRQAFDVEDIVMLPDSGHWPFADNPEAVAGAVLPFLRRHAHPHR